MDAERKRELIARFEIPVLDGDPAWKHRELPKQPLSAVEWVMLDAMARMEDRINELLRLAWDERGKRVVRWNRPDRV